jgi:hypothetical protein
MLVEQRRACDRKTFGCSDRDGALKCLDSAFGKHQDDDLSFTNDRRASRELCFSGRQRAGIDARISYSVSRRDAVGRAVCMYCHSANAPMHWPSAYSVYVSRVCGSRCLAAVVVTSKRES